MKNPFLNLFSLRMLGATVLLFVIVMLIVSMAQNDKLVETDGPSPESVTRAVLREANQLLKAGQENTALGVLSRHLQASPNDIAVRMARAELMLKVGKIVEGEREIDAVLQLRPDLPAALWDKGLLMRNRGEPGEPLMKRAADHPNASPSLVGQFGMLLFETDRVAEATPYLERAATGMPERSRMALTSPPAWNAGPAPVSTTQRIASSRSARSNAAGSCSHICSL